MPDISEIRTQILESNTPKRIVIRMNTKALNPQDYRASADKVVNQVFPGWEDDPRILYLVIDVSTERTFIVIDVNHHDYNYHKAHRDKEIVPVHVLRQHGKRREWFLVRWPREDEYLCTQLAHLHNTNGYEPTPFLEDHTSPTSWANTRCLP
ncbi:hypothetical protein N7457_001587 [Penicillium paradoxum]|uniref:uncharacterized protein n=1 Tax=Penicillium paradoxum TaxID=176176 RepID=UPI002546A62E|nr:uncharacterized protein N7457_001587 [Penicillium paradoxum]KAJ5794988.1 hypothetical protein N7457_001587 [Penicillium paradoxum]